MREAAPDQLKPEEDALGVTVSQQGSHKNELVRSVHHGSAVQVTLVAELFLLLILGGEIGDDALICRADSPLAAKAVQVPLLAGARRQAAEPGTSPGNEKPTARSALFDMLI